MTVSILNQKQKEAIAEICEKTNVSKQLLGNAVGVSRRSIERVCKENSEVKAKEKQKAINPKMEVFEELMQKHKITVEELSTLLSQTPPSIIGYMKQDRSGRKPRNEYSFESGDEYE